MNLNDIIQGLIGSQTPAVQQANQAWQQRDPRQDRLGQVIPGAGIIPSALTALSAMHQDTPRSINGQQAMAGMAMPFGGPTKTPPEVLESNINNRNILYHATEPESVGKIIESGAIKPSGGEPIPVLGGGVDDLYGVSVSRVPRVHTQADKAVTFALDATKVPPTRPYTEPGYGKTIGTKMSPFYRDENTQIPNRKFEFEERTYNQPIPTSAIKEMLIDKSGLTGKPYIESKAPNYSTWLEDSGKGEQLDELLTHAKNLGVPVKVFNSGRDLHSYRARIGNE